MLNRDRDRVALHAKNVQQMVEAMEDLVDQVEPAAATGNSQSIAYRQGVLDSLEIVRQMWLAACLVIGGRNRLMALELLDVEGCN